MICCASGGIPATRYHAGLSEEERQRNQGDFQFDRKTVMVATNAFGMGIDKSNVSFVIHYNMPKSLEAYYQEAGRAGRDGEAAECILLYGPGDVATAQFFPATGGRERGPLPRGTGGGSGAGRPAPGGHGELLQDHPLPPRAPSGLFWPGPRSHLRQLWKLPEPICPGGHHPAGADDPLLRQAGPGKAGVLCGRGPAEQSAPGEPEPAGAHAGIGWADHLWPAAGHLGGLDTPLSGGAGGGGVSGYRACSQDPPAHSPPGGGGPFRGARYS